MARFARLAVMATLGGVMAGCGQSPQQQQTDQIQKNAQQLSENAARMSDNAQDVAKGFETMARGLAAATTGVANLKPVDPVDFKELQAMLPDVPGWEKRVPKAERMTSPVSFSYASTTYKKDDRGVTEKITDSGFNQLLVAPISMMLSAGYSKRSVEGFEKSTTVSGYPAFEKWDKSDKSAQLTVFVNQRFLVELEGSPMSDSKELRAFLARTDLRLLAAMK